MGSCAGGGGALAGSTPAAGSSCIGDGAGGTGTSIALCTGSGASGTIGSRTVDGACTPPRSRHSPYFTSRRPRAMRRLKSA
eukprot:3427857-Prymnesium_polylepis.1